jgi:hypothetical protein
MDVHKEAVVIAVLNSSGKLVMESIVETKASSILQFIHGLGGELHVTWEEGTWAAWLYDLLQPQVEQVRVCDPRGSNPFPTRPRELIPSLLCARDPLARQLALDFAARVEALPELPGR